MNKPMLGAFSRPVVLLTLSLALAGCKAKPATQPVPVAGQVQVLQSDGTYGPPVAGTGSGQQVQILQPNGSYGSPVPGHVITGSQAAVAGPQPPASAANTGAPITGSNQPGTPVVAQSPAVPLAPVAPPPSAPAGTAVTFRTNQSISSLHNQIGDHFSGSLVRPIVSHGETVFAAGTPVAGDVVALNRKGRFKGAGDLGIVLVEVGGHRVETSEYEKVLKGVGRRTTGLVAGGAGLGALIGGLAGHGRGALIGGLAGAGAGAGASTIGNRSITLPAESVVTVRLSTQLTR